MTISGGSISGPKAIEQAAKQSENTKESIETIKLSVTGGSFTGEIESKNLKKFVSDGGFSTDLRNTGYLADSAAAEIKRAGDTTYVYYTTTEDAMAAAQPGDTVTFLNVSPEQPVTLTLQFNDGITLPTPTRSRYTFIGWYDGGTKVSSPYTVSATVTLNAVWRYNSSGGGFVDPTYPVSAPSKSENGTVTISPKYASKGDTVTITVKPDSICTRGQIVTFLFRAYSK